MDVENLPTFMDTEEMRQALGVLDHFAQDKDDYLLYLSRLDAVREAMSWEAELKEMKEALERKDSQLEQKDLQLKQKDSQLDQKDVEIKRLMSLLEKSGVSGENVKKS